MSTRRDVPRVPLQLSRGVVVASIQVDLDEDVVKLFQQDLLERVQESGARGVVFDLSALETLDSEEFRALRRVVSMASIMGAESVLSGLRPGVVSALLETGAEVDGLRGATNIDHAFELLQPQDETSLEPEPEEPEPEEPEAEAVSDDAPETSAT